MLTRDQVRDRLAAAAEGRPERGWEPGDQGALDLRSGQTGGRGRAPTPAAVLVGLLASPGGPAVVLTQRTSHLRDHGGQISFPGGRIEADDADSHAAALREAEEEIGLDPDRVTILGQLAPYLTITGFRIHPVVGWIEPPFSPTLDPFEVAEVFEVPLGFVLDPANHQRQTYRRGPLTRAYYVLPYQRRFIWGATAGILVNLSRLLQG